LAVSEYRKSVDGEQATQDVSFIRCKAWSKGAETIAKLGGKGSQLSVTTSFKQDRYEKDGEKKSAEYFRVNSFEFLRIKKSEDSEGEDEPQTTPDSDGDDAPF